MTKYIHMDGVDDYLLLPSLSEGRARLEILVESGESITNSAGNFKINMWDGIINYSENGISQILIDGVKVINNETVFPFDKRVVVDIIYFDYNYWNNYIFTSYGAWDDFSKGYIYDLKYFDSDDILIAHYDMSTGTVLDQSGNGRHATLYGGTWESTIVTDGLVGYWNSKQGVVGNTWHNIAPATKGKYDGLMSGAILKEDNWTEGVWFDGVDDYVYIPVDGLESFESFTIEFRCTFKEYWWSSPFTVNVDELGFWWGGYAIGAWMGNGDSEINHISYSDTTHHITFVHDASKHASESISWYVNGVLNTESIGMSDTSINPFIEATEIVFTEGLYGYYHFARLYNRALTPEEVAQNSLARDNVGLPEEEVSSPPQITIINVDRYKISGNPPIDKSVITFKSDINISNWTANVLGVSHDTGTIADSGETIKAGTEAIAVVDWTKIQEGVNRVNIYGRSSNGLWTPYVLDN